VVSYECTLAAEIALALKALAHTQLTVTHFQLHISSERARGEKMHNGNSSEIGSGSSSRVTAFRAVAAAAMSDKPD
jgi:hypothetical protein